MGREDEQQLGEDVEEAGPAESEGVETERGGWPETESSPHEGEEGQDVV